jgi:hypothetical protein
MRPGITLSVVSRRFLAPANAYDTSKSVNGIVPFTDLSLRSLYLLARPRVRRNSEDPGPEQGGNGTDETRCLNDPH